LRKLEILYLLKMLLKFPKFQLFSLKTTWVILLP
jgi:hypothetical protein